MSLNVFYSIIEVSKQIVAVGSSISYNFSNEKSAVLRISFLLQ